MRWFNLGSIWLVIFAVGMALAALPASAAGPKRDDDGVSEFIRTHPGEQLHLTPHPPYPLVSRARQEQGDLTIKVTFARTGRVSAVELIKSSGYSNLDLSTVYYIKAHWRSKFGKVGTITVPMRYTL